MRSVERKVRSVRRMLRGVRRAARCLLRGRATGGAVAWMVVYGGVLFFERYPYAEVEVELEWFFLVGVVAALSGSGSCPRRGSLI